ncbi:hypothetical protein ATANTOWER_002710, partial [Ataeniobius toweri]|nr:hypothetical protein [Ataeniobius toweri]
PCRRDKCNTCGKKDKKSARQCSLRASSCIFLSFDHNICDTSFTGDVSCLINENGEHTLRARRALV